MTPATGADASAVESPSPEGVDRGASGAVAGTEEGPMRILFFTNTPAHVHLFRGAVSALQARGHEVRVLAREDECSTALLEWYDQPFDLYGRLDAGKRWLGTQLPRHFWRILREARRFGPDLVFGIGPYAAFAGVVSNAPTVLVLDSEPTLDHVLPRPFVRAILTPDAFRRDLGEKHFVFRGFKECAYLHPEVYRPQSDVRAELGLDEGEPFAVVRLNSFVGHHDIGKRGFDDDRRRELIEALAEDVTVLVSDEGGVLDFDSLPAEPYALHPALIHDALSEAELLVADTQTMVTEAALLGTPAVRSNSFVGENDMGNFVELERAGLIFNVRGFDDVISLSRELLRTDGVGTEWARKRDDYLSDKVNLTELLLDVVTNADDVGRIDGLSKPKGS